jgi:NADPH:quinone reductase-like Zn-dependent oxidoreductase
VREHVWPLIEDGLVKPTVHATFPMEDVVEAHRLVDGGAHIGKVVITTSTGSDPTK